MQLNILRTLCTDFQQGYAARQATFSSAAARLLFCDIVNVFAGEQQQRVLGDLESQYVAGLRRKDGRTVGLGL